MLEKGIEAWEPPHRETGAWKGGPAFSDRLQPFVVETDKTLPRQIRSTASLHFWISAGTRGAAAENEDSPGAQSPQKAFISLSFV